MVKSYPYPSVGTVPGTQVLTFHEVVSKTNCSTVLNYVDLSLCWELVFHSEYM